MKGRIPPRPVQGMSAEPSLMQFPAVQQSNELLAFLAERHRHYAQQSKHHKNLMERTDGALQRSIAIQNRHSLSSVDFSPVREEIVALLRTQPIKLPSDWRAIFRRPRRPWHRE